MDFRKIQLVGNRSYAVSLPKEWVISNKLKAQDGVYIDMTNDNKLIITTKHIEKQKIMDVNIDEIYNLADFIMFAYVKNIDRLILRSKKLTYETTIQIRNIINLLEGYDIVHEELGKIEIAFLFKDVQITVQDIHRRMLYLINTMVQAVYARDYQNVAECESNIDRLYYLSKRIVASCIGDIELQEKNQSTQVEDLFFLKDISKKLENIGDALFEYSDAKFTLVQQEKIKILLDVIAQMISSKRDLHKIGEILKNFKYEDTTRSGTMISKIYTRCKNMFRNVMYLEYNRSYFSK
jgi:phosphate uptake regulator